MRIDVNPQNREDLLFVFDEEDLRGEAAISFDRNDLRFRLTDAALLDLWDELNRKFTSGPSSAVSYHHVPDTFDIEISVSTPKSPTSTGVSATTQKSKPEIPLHKSESVSDFSTVHVGDSFWYEPFDDTNPVAQVVTITEIERGWKYHFNPRDKGGMYVTPSHMFGKIYELIPAATTFRVGDRVMVVGDGGPRSVVGSLGTVWEIGTIRIEVKLDDGQRLSFVSTELQILSNDVSTTSTPTPSTKSPTPNSRPSMADLQVGALYWYVSDGAKLPDQVVRVVNKEDDVDDDANVSVILSNPQNGHGHSCGGGAPKDNGRWVWKGVQDDPDATRGYLTLIPVGTKLYVPDDNRLITVSRVDGSFDNGNYVEEGSTMFGTKYLAPLPAVEVGDTVKIIGNSPLAPSCYTGKFGEVVRGNSPRSVCVSFTGNQNDFWHYDLNDVLKIDPKTGQLDLI